MGGADDPISGAGIEAQTERRDVWPQQGESGVGQIDVCPLPGVRQGASGALLHAESPARRSARTWGPGALSREAQEGGLSAATWLILLYRRHSHTIEEQLSCTSGGSESVCLQRGRPGFSP